MEQWLRKFATDLKSLERFLNKSYRDSYLDATVRTGVAYQIYALRAKLGLSQTKFAQKIGKPQSTVSRLEDESYGKVTISTLLDVAKSMDVALVVRFVDYSEFLHFAGRMSESEMQPDSVYETFKAASRPRLRPTRIFDQKERENSSQSLQDEGNSPRVGSIKDRFQPSYAQVSNPNYLDIRNASHLVH